MNILEMIGICYLRLGDGSNGILNLIEAIDLVS